MKGADGLGTGREVFLPVLLHCHLDVSSWQRLCRGFVM